jgi:hypothetical protein
MLIFIEHPMAMFISRLGKSERTRSTAMLRRLFREKKSEKRVNKAPKGYFIAKLALNYFPPVSAMLHPLVILADAREPPGAPSAALNKIMVHR